MEKLDEEWNERILRKAYELIITENIPMNLIPRHIESGFTSYSPTMIEYGYLPLFYKIYNLPVIIIPGSFNPLHSGHEEIYYKELLQSSSGTSIFFEISLNNRSKGIIEFGDLLYRVKQFDKNDYYYNILLTNAPYFYQKILYLGQNLIFSIGIDSAIRLLQDDGFENVENMPAIFHVYDREIDGQLVTLPDLGKVPSNFLRFTTTNDVSSISSSKIRAGLIDSEGNKLVNNLKNNEEKEDAK